MKKQLFSLIVIIGLTLQITKATSDDMEWRNVSKEDLQKTQSKTFPDAEAIILFDKGELSYQLTNNSPIVKLVLTRHIRIKVFSHEGRKYARVRAPYPKNAVVQYIKGRSYRWQNGSVQSTKLRQRYIYHDKSNSDQNRRGDYFYSSNQDTTVNYLIFFVPDVVKGGIFEYKYNIVFDDYEKLMTWYFQNPIPTLHSQLELITPNFYKYGHVLQGEQGLDSTETKSITHSIKGNVKASFIAEFITPATSYVLQETNLGSNYPPILAKNPMRFQQEVDAKQTFFMMKNVPARTQEQTQRSISKLSFNLQSFSQVNPMGIINDEFWLRLINAVGNQRPIIQNNTPNLLTMQRASNFGIEQFQTQIQNQRRFTRRGRGIQSMRDDFLKNPMRAVFPGEINNLQVRADLPPGTGSWEQLNFVLLYDSRFGGQLKTNKGTARKIKEVLSEGMSELEKMKAIYAFVQKNVRWNSEYDVFTSQSLRKTYQSGSGNSADVNLLLTLLLKEAELDAQPVVMSTQSNGVLLRPYPDLRRLNQVLVSVKIDEKTHLLDATDFLRGYNLLSVEDMNIEGWRIDQKNYGWENIKHQHSRMAVEANMHLNHTQNLEGDISYMKTNFIALEKRREIYEKQLENKLKQVFEARMNEAVVSTMGFSNLIDFEKPLESYYEFVTLDDVEKNEDTLKIQPFMMERLLENPYPEPSVDYPVQIKYPDTQTYIFNLEIPDGYELVSYPQATSLDFERELSDFLIKQQKDPRVAQFSFKTSFKNNTVKIVSTVRTYQNEIFPEEYPLLRVFYIEVMKKQREQIILKKKK